MGHDDSTGGRSLEGTSKFLCYLLRHRPDKVGLTLGRDGWVRVDDLLAGIAAHGSPLDRDTLLEVVARDRKGRYGLSEDGTLIRANQGHGRRTGVVLALPRRKPPAVLYHGTKAAFLDGIRRKGLLPMSRQHVHLSGDEATAADVGDRRNGETVILCIDAAAMDRDGHAFRISDNGVWLVDAVPARYLTFPR